jgi:hypothetical protein
VYLVSQSNGKYEESREDEYRPFQETDRDRERKWIHTRSAVQRVEELVQPSFRVVRVFSCILIITVADRVCRICSEDEGVCFTQCFSNDLRIYVFILHAIPPATASMV